MTIRHLKIFICVVDSGSMTNAAKKLFITQPSVSQAIMEIEEFYNIKLFERLSKKLYITEEGEEFLSYARHIVSLFKDMEQKMGQARKTSTLRIGASATIGTSLFSQLANRFLEKNNNIQIEAVVDNTTIIEEMVIGSKLDFALVEGPIHSKDIIPISFMEDELIVICGKKHPFVNKKSMTLEELSKEELILRESGSGTRELFENTLFSKGLNPNIKWVCNNSEAIKNAVISNIGMSVISKMAVKSELEEEKLFHIPLDNIKFHRNFNIIYHKNKYITKAMKTFWKLCLEK